MTDTSGHLVVNCETGEATVYPLTYADVLFQIGMALTMKEQEKISKAKKEKDDKVIAALAKQLQVPEADVRSSLRL